MSTSNMVKIISVSTEDCFFHGLGDDLSMKINNWLYDTNIEIVSATTSMHSVEKNNNDEENVIVMACTIIYNEIS